MGNVAAAKRRLGAGARRAVHIAHRKRRDSHRGYPDLHQTHRLVIGDTLSMPASFPDTTGAVTFKFRVDRTVDTATGIILDLGDSEGSIGFDAGNLEVVTGSTPTSFTGTFVGAPRDDAEVVVAIQPTTGQVRAWVDSELVIAGTTIVFPFSWGSTGSMDYDGIIGVDVLSELDVFDGQLPRHFGEVETGDVGVALNRRFQMNHYGEDTGNGVTAVELMEENTAIGIPFARAVQAGNVAVKFRRDGGTAPGNWTLRLFKNGVEVATFPVSTT